MGSGTSNSRVTHIYILDARAGTGVQPVLTDPDAGAAGFLFEGAVEGQQHGVLTQGKCKVEHIVGCTGLLGTAESEGVAVDFRRGNEGLDQIKEAPQSFVQSSMLSCSNWWYFQRVLTNSGTSRSGASTWSDASSRTFILSPSFLLRAISMAQFASRTTFTGRDPRESSLPRWASVSSGCGR